MLVQFQEDHIPGLEFSGMQEELSEIMGRKVDLKTVGFLNDTFRDKVIAGAMPIYKSHPS